MDRQTGATHLYAVKSSRKVEDPETEIGLEEAQKSIQTTMKKMK